MVTDHVDADTPTGRDASARLRAALGTAVGAEPAGTRPAPDPHAAWAASGGMWLTGLADGPPLGLDVAVMAAPTACAHVIAEASAALGRPVEVDVADALTGRAAQLGLRRNGRISANGSCRLLRCADGWFAVNLARPTDVELVAALVEQPVDDVWATLARVGARRSRATLEERARLLGMPLGVLPDAPVAVAPLVMTAVGPSRAAPPERPLVVDLSALWAGPLCAHLLGRAGMEVVKIESARRPDGARLGNRAFFDRLHGGHRSVALDLGTEGDRDALRRLLGRADVVVESSRPRALEQLGIVAEAMIAERGGLTWVSITGHGRSGAARHAVGFGDDAAVAAGLVARDADGDPVFCADAIADPLAGLHAAAAALTSVASGGGHLVDVSLRGAAAAAAAVRAPRPPAARRRNGRWTVPIGGRDVEVRPPRRPPRPTATSRALGADTDAVLADP